jgi:hypothetical protein
MEVWKYGNEMTFTMTIELVLPVFRTSILPY